MGKQIFPNRWFIWAIVFIVVVGVGLWSYIEYALIEMDYETSESQIVFSVTIHKKIATDTSRQEALEVAQASSECSNVGVLTDLIIYNAGTKTWWIDLERTPELEGDGCNPACVVNEETKTAEVNWRCTGLLPE